MSIIVFEEKNLSLRDTYQQWKQDYDDWLASKGKNIKKEKTQESKNKEKTQESKNMIEKAKDFVQIITDPETTLKQITRIAVILIVGMVGIMALLQIMPVKEIIPVKK